MPNPNYVKGYRTEHKVQLILEYNGWHVNRNHASKGVEDLVAIKKGKQPMFLQCKNTKLGKKSMSQREQTLFALHAVEYGAAPIYVYVVGRKEFYLNLETKKYLSFKPFTKKWLSDRRKYKAILKAVESETKKQDLIINIMKKVKHIICGY